MNSWSGQSRVVNSLLTRLVGVVSGRDVGPSEDGFRKGFVDVSAASPGPPLSDVVVIEKGASGGPEPFY